MEQIKQEIFNEDERVYDFKIALREPSIERRYKKFKSVSSQYIVPVYYGLKIGLLAGMVIGSFYGIYRTIRTKNPYYIPISAFVYGGVFGITNSLFYLVRS